MEPIEIKLFLFGILTTVCGAGQLYLVWKDRVQLREMFVTGAVLLFGVSGACWIILTSWQIGILYSFLVSFVPAVLAYGRIRNRESDTMHLTR